MRPRQAPPRGKPRRARRIALRPLTGAGSGAKVGCPEDSRSPRRRGRRHGRPTHQGGLRWNYVGSTRGEDFGAFPGPHGKVIGAEHRGRAGRSGIDEARFKRRSTSRTHRSGRLTASSTATAGRSRPRCQIGAGRRSKGLIFEDEGKRAGLPTARSQSRANARLAGCGSSAVIRLIHSGPADHGEVSTAASASRPGGWR